MTVGVRHQFEVFYVCVLYGGFIIDFLSTDKWNNFDYKFPRGNNFFKYCHVDVSRENSLICKALSPFNVDELFFLF